MSCECRGCCGASRPIGCVCDNSSQVPENYFVLEALDKVAKIAKDYIKETRACGDECLAKTVCSDIHYDIKELRKSYDPTLKDPKETKV